MEIPLSQLVKWLYSTWMYSSEFIWNSLEKEDHNSSMASIHESIWHIVRNVLLTAKQALFEEPSHANTSLQTRSLNGHSSVLQIITQMIGRIQSLKHVKILHTAVSIKSILSQHVYTWQNNIWCYRGAKRCDWSLLSQVNHPESEILEGKEKLDYDIMRPEIE